MASRKVASIVEAVQDPASPASFIELWHWMKHRPYKQSGVDIVNFETALASVQRFHDVTRSDDDEQPARVLHAEFIAHLQWLEYDKIKLFCLTDGVGHVRFADVQSRAESLCRRLMVTQGEVPAGWDDAELPTRPLRTVDDLATWLDFKRTLLANMATSLDGGEPLFNAEEMRQVIVEYEYQQTQENAWWLATGLVPDPNVPNVVKLDDALKPLDEFHHSNEFGTALLATKKGEVERILRQAIRGVELWLDAHDHILGRPDKLTDLDTLKADVLESHLLKLRRYLAELKHVPPANGSPWPPDNGWHFIPGAAWFCRHKIEASGKLWSILKAFAEATQNTLSEHELKAACWEGSEPESSTIRSHLSNLRTTLKDQLKLTFDPLPVQDETHSRRGWKLDVESIRSAFIPEE